MMTHDEPKENVSVSTMWRGIDDSSIEEVYYFLFHSAIAHTSALPSVLGIEFVEPSILNYIKKELKGELICSTDCIRTSKPKPIDDDDIVEDFIDDDDRIFMFVVRTTKYPVLIRLCADRHKFKFCACSINEPELAEFVKPLAKQFGYKSDYTNVVSFGVLYPEGSHLTIKELPLDETYIKGMDLTLNYGLAFAQHHDAVMNKLQNSKRGLFIFHGEPGTGKTTYIKYLAHLFGGKRMFIFVPTTNIETLASPALLPVLLDHQNSILVLEDAERAVVSREHQMGNESLVSTLLNIGDGILGSMLNIALIVTFNTRKEKIDSALLRKGRLLYEHEFKALAKEDAKRLLTRLNNTHEPKDPMTLADIYNLTSNTGHKEEAPTRIGFQV